MSKDQRPPDDPGSTGPDSGDLKGIRQRTSDTKTTMRAGLSDRFLLVTGIAAPLMLGLAVLFGGSLYPGYSHVSQFVSELGATGAPSPSVLNFGGLIPAGALTVAFALAMYRRYRPGTAVAVSSSLVALAGMSRLIAGIFPCEPIAQDSAGYLSPWVPEPWWRSSWAFSKARIPPTSAPCSGSIWRSSMRGL